MKRFLITAVAVVGLVVFPAASASAIMHDDAPSPIMHDDVLGR